LVALRETFQFIFLFGIYYLIFQLVKENGWYISKILIISGFAGLVVSAIGLFQYWFTRGPFSFRIDAYHLRAYATFGHPNAFGSYMIGLIPLLVGCYNFNEKNRWKIAILGCLFIFSLSLYASYSRGSWVGLVIGIGVMLFIARKYLVKKSLLLPLFTILLAAVLILGDTYYPSLMKPKPVSKPIIGDFWRESRFSNLQRFLLAKSALAMTIDHPLVGVGPGNYSVLLSQYASKELMESIQWDYDPKTNKAFANSNKKVDIVHNMFLQIFAETGLIGLALFLWLLYANCKTSLRLLRQCKLPINKKEYSIRAGLIGSFTAIMAGGLFGWPFCHGTQEVLVLSMALGTSPWE
jgi:putative inorganic carbon (HCO3(-)) transporter